MLHQMLARMPEKQAIGYAIAATFVVAAVPFSINRLTGKFIIVTKRRSFLNFLLIATVPRTKEKSTCVG